MQITILGHKQIIDVEECYQTLDIDVIDFDGYLKIDGNKIEEAGPDTLYFDSVSDPFEILYNEGIEITNIEFITDTVYHAYHTELGMVIRNSFKRSTITDLVNQYPFLKLTESEKYVSYRYV